MLLRIMYFVWIAYLILILLALDINLIILINSLLSINDILLSDQVDRYIYSIPAAINGPEQRSWMAQLCVQYGEILPLQTQLRCLQ